MKYLVIIALFLCISCKKEPVPYVAKVGDRLNVLQSAWGMPDYGADYPNGVTIYFYKSKNKLIIFLDEIVIDVQDKHYD